MTAPAFTWTISAVTAADGLVTATTQEMPCRLIDGTLTTAPHSIQFGIDAIASRSVAYDLQISRDACEAIFRQFGAAQAGVAFDPADLTTVAIVYTGTASADLDSILAANGAAITAAQAAYSPSHT